MSSPADDSVLYPVLSDDEMASLRHYGIVRQTTAGQVLLSPADDVYDLIIILGGRVEVTHDSHGRSGLLARLGPGQFAGELNLLTGQRPSGTARVTVGGEIIVVAAGQLRELIAASHGHQGPPMRHGFGLVAKTDKSKARRQQGHQTSPGSGDLAHG
jgi:CRP-like cAMP-binding protein